jgi:hypothetical protein
MSGKVNELIDVFVAQLNPSASGWNQGRIETQPPRRSNWRLFLGQRALNSVENQTASRTAFSSGDFVHPTVEILRQIDGSSNKSRLHRTIFDCAT